MALFHLASQRRPVFARMGGPVLYGHAVNARRSLVDLTLCHARARFSLASTASSGYCFASSCFKARCAPAAGASPPDGVIDAFGVGLRLLLVSRCSAIQRPDSWPPTAAFADFCAITARVAARRAVRLDGGCCRFIAWLRTGGLRCHVPARLASLGPDYAVCSPSLRTSCTPASSRPCLATSPLPSARGYPCSR